jgi:hypothetical protein
MPYRRRQRLHQRQHTPVPLSDVIWRLICTLFLLLALGGAYLAGCRAFEEMTGTTLSVPPPANPASRTTPGG